MVSGFRDVYEAHRCSISAVKFDAIQSPRRIELDMMRHHSEMSVSTTALKTSRGTVQLKLRKKDDSWVSFASAAHQNEGVEVIAALQGSPDNRHLPVFIEALEAPVEGLQVTLVIRQLP
jgi:hypothetical protein